MSCEYANQVLNSISNRYPWEKEFIQAVTEVLQSVSPALERRPDWERSRVLERLVEPERTVSFRVPWRNDRGEVEVSTGYRVEFNSALGPYKGGLRFHPSVNQSILKFLGFEQIFKNALTGLPMGGGKGGADFVTRGRSDGEIMAFCQSFMTELARHIGPNTDVPAGDIGVGGREIGFMFGQYKRIRNAFECSLTGKGSKWGGSLIRPEATGYGLVYFTNEMLAANNMNLAGMRVAVSGFGNVAWGAIKKVNELGGRVITLSGPDGYIHDADGIVGEKVDFLLKMRGGGNDRVEDYAKQFKVPFVPKARPWEIPCDIALPCATQNEMDAQDVKTLIKNGVKCIAEGANLPLTLEAQHLVIEHKIPYAPGKASNAGGVAVSGLEMTQNSTRLKWSAETVDSHLKQIMKDIHATVNETAKEFKQPGNYLAGANIAAICLVADAMLDQGVV